MSSREAAEVMAPQERAVRDVDVLVVGAGPAGLTAAAELARRGAGVVEVLDREREAGGVPRHSHHTGYGLRDLRRVMTGPAYARRLTGLAVDAGALVGAGVSVTGWGPATDDSTVSLETTSPAGLALVRARAVVLATGARERPRAARWVPGDRPAGVLTTGQLQQAVYLHHQHVGSRAVIVGAEHVSFSAAVTLAHAGAEVAAMVTGWPQQQSFRAFRAGASLRYGFPLLTSTTVVRVVGRGRVSGVEVRHDDGRTALIPCDTVVFTGDWVPDHELAVHGGLVLDPGTRGPAVDPALRTSAPGVFAVGNLVHPVTTADVAALDGRHVADAVMSRLRGQAPVLAGPPLVAAGALRWISPNRVTPGDRPPRGELVAWGAAFVSRPTVTVVQDGRELHRARSRRGLVPQRPFAIDARWLPHVDPVGGEVVISVH